MKRLPRYKRPRKIIFGEVPRNPTGKIEKPKLRKKYGGKEEAFKMKDKVIVTGETEKCPATGEK